MLDDCFMKGVKKFVENDNYIVWEFPASKDAYEKQARPLIYSYSIMSRAYGTNFNDDNFIKFFNDEGFDVYLVDWGTSSLFSLSGWTLDNLADDFEKLITSLLRLYPAEKTLNVFAVCIGGAILSYLIGKKGKDVSDKIHRLAYYGVPIIGARDLGMEKSFKTFYEITQPYQAMLKNWGVSLFLLDSLILNSVSMSMLTWTWDQYFKENKNGSLANIINWTFDDRWVPYSALTDIIYQGFIRHKHEFHIAKKDNIHFLNIVGKDDMLVKPSASIIEWNSPIPQQYSSFKQMILNTDHFMFARPGFEPEKTAIAWWFAGYDFSSLIYRLKTDKIKYQMVADRAELIISDAILNGYRKASDVEKELLITSLNEVLENNPSLDNIEDLSDRLIAAVKVRNDMAFYEAVERKIMPFVNKSEHRQGE